jgi:hypothetical protein
VLPFRDTFGDSELERAVAAFARTTVEAVSFESAMVTAYEREQGALIYGAAEDALRRAQERQRLRVAAGRSNLELASKTLELARAYADGVSDAESAFADWSIGRLRDEAADRDLLELATVAFPDVVATIEQAGYPISNLSGARLTVEEGSFVEVVTRLESDLEAAADATAAYGRALLGSEPPEGGQAAPLSPPMGPTPPSRVPGEAQRRFAEELVERSRRISEALRRGLRNR